MSKRRLLFHAAVATLSIGLFAPLAQAETTFKMPARGALEGRSAEPDRFVMGGVTIGCEEGTYTWNAGRIRTLVLFPEYSECTARALNGFPGDFYQETCTYVLHHPRPLGNKERWQATVAISCTGEWTAVGFDVYETEQKYSEVRAVCATRIPEQANAGTAELRNLPGKRSGIEVRWDLNRIEYSVISPTGSLSSSLFCGSTLGGTRGDARYEGTAVITAKDSSERPSELRVVG